MTNYQKTVFISDIHAPYQDEIALHSLKEFIKWFKPDDLVFLGDVIDFYAVSSFVKDPERALKLQEEIDEAKHIIDDICKVSIRSKKFFIKGNHEGRLQKYLWSSAKELSGLRSLQLESLLDFKKHNISYIKDGKMFYKGIIVKHGNVVRKFAGYTAKAEFEKNGMSGVSAHSHRLSQYRHANESGDYVWVESGCLCKLDPEYLEGEVANWQQGFSIGYFKEHSKRFHLETVPIVRGKSMYGGREFY